MAMYERQRMLLVFTVHSSLRFRWNFLFSVQFFRYVVSAGTKNEWIINIELNPLDWNSRPFDIQKIINTTHSFIMKTNSRPIYIYSNLWPFFREFSPRHIHTFSICDFSFVGALSLALFLNNNLSLNRNAFETVDVSRSVASLVLPPHRVSVCANELKRHLVGLNLTAWTGVAKMKFINVLIEIEKKHTLVASARCERCFTWGCFHCIPAA